jgi:hypothetical protein
LTEHQIDIGVVVARKKLKGPWADRAWLPHAVLPGAPPAAAWTTLAAAGEDELFYAGHSVLTLHAADAAHYRDNLGSARPSLWVSLHLLGADSCGIARITANPYEGEALTEGIGTIVEAVPMPAAIQAELLAFVEAFPAEPRFVKRERDRADPEALARRPPAPHPRETRR